MSEPSLLHHTFSLERSYRSPAGDVFAAWADPRAKKRWFTGDSAEHSLDFRIGGLEIVESRGDDQKVLVFESRYVDIVEDKRIVYTSTLAADGALATTSITSVELRPDNGGTVLTLTESDVFLDGQEQPSWREHGTADWLDKLGAEFQTLTR
jgi:uncharacterized protein YndB with AHSA1/START domain